MVYRMGGMRRNSGDHLVVYTDDEFDELSPAQREAWKGYTYKMTYEIVTPESAEDGDAEERGWVEEGSEPYDSLQAVLRATRDHNWLEWSDSNPDGVRSWLVSEGEQDYRSGADTSYSLWIERADRKPKSEEEIDYISEAFGISGFGRMRRNSMDEFTRGFLETALWSSTDNSDDSGGEPLDKNYSIDDIAPESVAGLSADCRRFQHENAADLKAAYEHGIRNSDAGDEFSAGHDFWLTRCGHGAGFWDGDYPEPQATRLTKASEKFGNVDLYIGDDGVIYASGYERALTSNRSRRRRK